MAEARMRTLNSRYNAEDVRREKAYAARKSRAGYLGRMTHLYSKIEQLMVDYSNVDAVKPIKTDLDDAYRKFVDTNKDLLENLDDDSEVQGAIQVYENQTKGKLEFDDYYRKWLENIEEMRQVPANTVDDNLTRASSQRSNKIKELKAKRTAAELKANKLKALQQLERQQFELQQQRQVLEVQSEIDQAEAEQRIWEDDDNPDEDQLRRHSFPADFKSANPFSSQNIFHAMQDGLKVPNISSSESKFKNPATLLGIRFPSRRGLQDEDHNLPFKTKVPLSGSNLPPHNPNAGDQFVHKPRDLKTDDEVPSLRLGLPQYKDWRDNYSEVEPLKNIFCRYD